MPNQPPARDYDSDGGSSVDSFDGNTRRQRRGAPGIDPHRMPKKRPSQGKYNCCVPRKGEHVKYDVQTHLAVAKQEVIRSIQNQRINIFIHQLKYTDFVTDRHSDLRTDGVKEDLLVLA